jgi:hypothetical protein
VPRPRHASLAPLSAVLTLAACAAPGGPAPKGAGVAGAAAAGGADSGAGPGDGGADTGGAEGGGEVAAVLGLDAISAGGQVALNALYESDPRALQAVYEGVRAQGDAACPPYSGAYAGQVYWEGSCVAASGAAFEGWALSSWAEGFSAPAEGLRYDALAWYYGLSRGRDAAGSTLEAWGNNDLRVWSSTDGQRWGVHAAMGGSFLWAGAGPDFLHAGADHGWSLDLERAADGRRSLVAEGGIGLLQGTFDAFAFDEVWAEVAPGGCQDEPNGRVHLREAATGRWYDVAFDPAACDGCGAATLITAEGEQALGEACLSWAPLLRWEVDPWSG